MERAVVATKVDAIPEIVKDGVTGFVVSPQDSRGLADRVRALLEEPCLRENLGKAGRVAISEEHSLESMLDRTEQLYQSLLDGRARSPGDHGGRTAGSFMTCVLSAGRDA